MIDDAARWNRIKQVFQDALERPADEHERFLHSVCGDDRELRGEVESLLMAHAAAGSFAQGPAIEALPPSAAVALRDGTWAERRLQQGDRLGHYEMVSAIGKGGMGEVWKARDTTLLREVAIKMLPEGFAQDADRLARLEREATLLASLNHPNIATIHGLETHQGTRCLVLELVDGRTLADHLGRGPIPVEESLKLALQIAEALEAAHEKGVIHRDLKPVNIKVTPEGRVKVLDFGLAKALAPASEDVPSLTATATEVGVIMGTPAYMSPEQARGEAVGRQADIWSFGVVLYELLTGASLFGRQTKVETLASVLGTQPDYSVLPSDTPARVRHLVRRCLEKDLKRRLRDIGDVRIEVEEALSALRTQPTVDDDGPRAVGAWPAPRRLALRDSAAHHTLPVFRTSLIGREQELEGIKTLLRDASVRLLTLTGAGGSGKTRLAIEAARDLTGNFPGGVHLLPLAPLVDSGGIATSLAHLVGLRQTAGKPLVDALLDYLKLSIYAATLLVLDNFEHVLSASPLVGRLLESSPHLRILVTSREVLHVYGEYEYPVPPLAIPDATRSFRDLEGNPSIRLFVERAQAANRAFELTASNAHAVAEICRRLDGLPLAIELAAPRSKIFSAEAILARLGTSLDFLTGGARDLPARQQTLRNTIDWSHTFLSVPEQKLFRRLAVFTGGCTLEGAEAVCDAARDLGVDVTRGISSLVDKSLVQQAGEIAGEPRFTMLETLREYARGQLAAFGDELPARRAHAAYCIVLAEEGNPQLTAREREEWLARCDVEADNFGASLDFVIESRNAEWALRLGLALFGYWERREHLAEGRRRLLEILKLGAGLSFTPAWAMATGYAATLSASQGDHEAGARLHEQSLEAWRALGDRRGLASALNGQGVTHRFAGNLAEARSYFEQALLLCQEIGDRAEIAAALSNLATAVSALGDETSARALLDRARTIFCELGHEVAATWTISHLGDVAGHHGHVAEAQRLYQDAIDGFSRLGDLWGTARSSADLGYAIAETGDHRTAHTLFIGALSTFLDLDHKRGIARTLEGLAYLAQRQQNFERALTLAGAAAAVRHAFGAAPRPSEQTRLERTLAPAWESQNHAQALVIWTAGRQMSLDDAVEYARRGVEPLHDS